MGGRPKPPPEPSCLYPSEDEIARLLLGDRASRWPEVAIREEAHGFPRVDPLYGGRYWPAVLQFYERRMKTIPEMAPGRQQQDDETRGENFDAIGPRRARSKTP